MANGKLYEIPLRKWSRAKKSFYNIWVRMRNRCQNTKDISYSRYGLRGIKVCEEWNNFRNFYKDMWRDYKYGLSIERINNNGNYEPYNCKWATVKEQANNRRNNKRFHFKELNKTLTEWAEYLGIKRSTLAQRFYVCGWRVDQVLSIPLSGRR